MQLLDMLGNLIGQTAKRSRGAVPQFRVTADEDDPDGQSLLVWYPTITPFTVCWTSKSGSGRWQMLLSPATVRHAPGWTGLVIVNGPRDPLELAKLGDPRIKASEETISKSLKSNWRPEHLFTLKQSRQMYQHYQERIAACDEEIENGTVEGCVQSAQPGGRPISTSGVLSASRPSEAEKKSALHQAFL